MARTKLQTPNFSLTKRADGYYHIRYVEDGTEKSKATGSKDPVEAEAARARFVQDFRKPKLTGKVTVNALCEAYTEHRRLEVANTKALDYCFTPIKRGMGDLYAEAITQTVVNDYVNFRLAERPARKGGRYADKPVGEATISKELRMLRAALKWAASERFLERTVTFRIELSAGGVRDQWITQDQAKLLIDDAPPHIALFIVIALGTAKRREAILSLTWDKVDMSRQGHEIIDFGDDIGNKRRGSTPIAGNARLLLALKEAKLRAKTPYVIEFKGERIKDVKTALTSLCKRTKIEKISAHVLKHTAITWMVQADMTYERISKFANTTKEVIERVYGHHSTKFVQEASSALSF